MTSISAIVQEAREFLHPYLSCPRIVFAQSLSEECKVYLKLETEMPTGSFKVRGALFALHAEIQRRRVTEVVAASTGNHGAAVAFAARALGLRATIFVPEGVNEVKRRRVQELGASIVEQGKDISEARQLATEHAAQADAFELDDAENPYVAAAAGTIVCEIMEQLPEVAAIWAPIGDSALIRGVASTAKRLRAGTRIVGVQSERAPAYYLSWRQGKTVSTETCDTIADGLATRIPLAANVRAIQELVDDIRLISDAEMLNAVRHLWFNDQIMAEPAGAATTAAWLAHPSAAPGAVVLLVTGGNISDSVRRQCLGSLP